MGSLGFRQMARGEIGEIKDDESSKSGKAGAPALLDSSRDGVG